MTDQEFDRFREFMLNQQVKFGAGMQQLWEAQAKTDERLRAPYGQMSEQSQGLLGRRCQF